MVKANWSQHEPGYARAVAGEGSAGVDVGKHLCYSPVDVIGAR